MNWLDIIILILLLASIFGGLISGLIRSVFSLAGLIVGIVLAGRYYETLAEYMTFISNETASRVLAFIIIFFIVAVIAFLLGALLTKVASAITLGWVNRLGGAVLGLFLGALFVGAILAVCIKFSILSGTISESVLASILTDRLPLVLALLPDEFDAVSQFFD